MPTAPTTFNNWLWKADLLTKNRPPQPLLPPYKQLIYVTLTLQMNQTEWPYFTNRSRPTNHDQPMPLESCSQQHHSRTDQSVYTNWTYNIRLTTTIPLTLMMTSAQVVEMSVTTTNNSPSQDYTHPDDQSTLTFSRGSNHLLQHYNWLTWMFRWSVDTHTKGNTRSGIDRTSLAFQEFGKS